MVASKAFWDSSGTVQTYRDSKVTVLEEILDWSHDRPTWQRDALRRLVLNGDLSDDDIRTLTQICKSAHGLTESQNTVPLTNERVPANMAGRSPVSLVSIFHHRRVNALADDQASCISCSTGGGAHERGPARRAGHL
jgi:hypothetical protein